MFVLKNKAPLCGQLGGKYSQQPQWSLSRACAPTEETVSCHPCFRAGVRELGVAWALNVSRLDEEMRVTWGHRGSGFCCNTSRENKTKHRRRRYGGGGSSTCRSNRLRRGRYGTPRLLNPGGSDDGEFVVPREGEAGAGGVLLWRAPLLSQFLWYLFKNHQSRSSYSFSCQNNALENSEKKQTNHEIKVNCKFLK